MSAAAGVAPDGSAVQVDPAQEELPDDLGGDVKIVSSVKVVLGEGQQPATPITIEFDAPPADEGRYMVLARSEGQEEYELLPSRIDADGVVSATSDHLSWFSLAWFDPRNITGALDRYLAGQVDLDLPAPDCHNKDLEHNGTTYSIVGTGGGSDFVYWCLEGNPSGSVEAVIHSNSRFVWDLDISPGGARSSAPVVATDTTGIATAIVDRTLNFSGDPTHTVLVAGGRTPVTIDADADTVDLSLFLSAHLGYIAILIGGLETALAAFEKELTPVQWKAVADCAVGLVDVTDEPLDAATADKYARGALACLSALPGVPVLSVIAAVLGTLIGDLSTQMLGVYSSLTGRDRALLTVTGGDATAAATQAALTANVESCGGQCTVSGAVPYIDGQARGVLVTLTRGGNGSTQTFDYIAAVAVAPDGSIIWQEDKVGGGQDPTPFIYEALASDTSGNVFVRYNQGRYDGVQVLDPSAGFVLQPGAYPPFWDEVGPYSPFGPGAYSAGIDDQDGDGLYEIVQVYNQSGMSAGEEVVWVWDGTTYLTTDEPVTRTVSTGADPAFVTPSGNIVCSGIFGDVTANLQCDIAEYTFAPDASVDCSQPTDLALSGRAGDTEVGWSCSQQRKFYLDYAAQPQEWEVAERYMDPGSGRDYAVLPYGTTLVWTGSNIECTSRRTGLTCVDKLDGVGFTLSSKTFEQFGSPD